MKKLMLTLAVAVALFGSTAEEVRDYLIQKSKFDIAGKFYMYDFDNDGINYNDWIFKANNGEQYRLLGQNPTPDNVFGWKKLLNPPYLSGEPEGYFVPIYMPNEDPKFSWIYIVASTKQVYKLIGANPNNTLRYLDIDGDGTPDPLPDINVDIVDDMIIVTSKDSSSITSITIATTYKGTYTLTGGEYAQYSEACYSGGEVTFYIQKNMYDEDNGYPVNGYTNTGEIIDGLYITQDGELYGIAVDADYVYTEWSGSVVGDKIIGTYNVEDGTCTGVFEVKAVE
jgi:hypothetical protein